jgi:hypothetical protein
MGPVRPVRGRVLTPAEWESEKRNEEFREVVPRTEGSGINGLILRPKSISFATQNRGEQVFMLLRRHWWINIGWITSEAFSASVPVFIYFLADLAGFNLVDILGWKLFATLLLMFYSVIITNTIRHLADWYFNLYLVTNQRVVDFDFHPFTSSGVSESSLNTIQDVKQKSVGFWASIFNYGDIEIFSAADRNVIKFNYVPNPTLVRDKILDLAEVAGKE